MTFSINITGSGGLVEDLSEVFSNTVRALREISEDPNTISGSISGSINGESFSFTSADVEDVEEVADGSEEDEEVAADEGLEEDSETDEEDEETEDEEV